MKSKRHVKEFTEKLQMNKFIFQTEPDQYSKFVSRHERPPISPVSFNLIGLQSDNKLLFTNKDINSKEFKYSYGVRSTLLDTKEINMSVIPFAKTLVHEFNSLVNGDDKIEHSSYDEFAKKLIKRISDI